MRDDIILRWGGLVLPAATLSTVSALLVWLAWASVPAAERSLGKAWIVMSTWIISCVTIIERLEETA